MSESSPPRVRSPHGTLVLGSAVAALSHSRVIVLSLAMRHNLCNFSAADGSCDELAKAGETPMHGFTTIPIRYNHILVRWRADVRAGAHILSVTPTARGRQIRVFSLKQLFQHVKLGTVPIRSARRLHQQVRSW